jgi:hypothetical protein
MSGVLVELRHDGKPAGRLRSAGRTRRGTGYAWLAGAVLVALSLGCSNKPSNRPKLVPASGRFLVDGKPLERTQILFHPDGHQYAAKAKTDADGCFHLETFDPKDGAAIGKYKVTAIHSTVKELPEGGIDEKFGFPLRYFDPEKSGLTAEVVENGKNEFEFDVPSK